MKLKNGFSHGTRNLFLYETGCWICKRSDKGLELHHVYGRTSSSPYNASVVCMECHSRMGHSVKEHRELLRKSVLFLSRESYRPSMEDIAFLESVRKDLEAIRD